MAWKRTLVEWERILVHHPEVWADFLLAPDHDQDENPFHREHRLVHFLEKRFKWELESKLALGIQREADFRRQLLSAIRKRVAADDAEQEQQGRVWKKHCGSIHGVYVPSEPRLSWGYWTWNLVVHRGGWDVDGSVEPDDFVPSLQLFDRRELPPELWGIVWQYTWGPENKH